MLLVAGLAVLEGRVEAVVVVVVVVLEGADTGAEYHREVVRRVQAGSDVGAVLALFLFVLAVFREVRHADVAVPVKDAAGHHGKLAGVPGGASLARMVGVQTDDQVMLATEQGERAREVEVGAVLHAMAFPAAPEERHAIAIAIRRTATGRGQAGVVVALQLVDGEFERPVVGQRLLQRGEVGTVLEVAAAPVGARVERA
ncbi:hypothetical protein D3C85_1259830 [compost metagenome]